MIAECDNEQTMLMWSTANELLDISNSNDEKTRLEEFKRRYSEARQQQVPFSSMNTSRKNRRTRSSNQRTTCQQVYHPYWCFCLLFIFLF
jgi:hypothetical protein